MNLPLYNACAQTSHHAHSYRLRAVKAHPRHSTQLLELAQAQPLLLVCLSISVLQEGRSVSASVSKYEICLVNKQFSGVLVLVYYDLRPVYNFTVVAMLQVGRGYICAQHILLEHHLRKSPLLPLVRLYTAISIGPFSLQSIQLPYFTAQNPFFVIQTRVPSVLRNTTDIHCSYNALTWGG